MRLIDAYTLAVQIRDNVFHDFTDEFWGVMQCIREAPTIEPERKTGRRISLDDFCGKYNAYGYKCSECGEYSEYEENYCPNCCADMKGDECDD